MTMIQSRHNLSGRRLFARRRSRLATSLLALAAVFVTACTEGGPPAPPPPNFSDIKVEWVVMTQALAFDAKATLPAATEIADLEEFLDRTGARLTDEIALEPAAGADPALARARAEALSKHMRRRLPGIRVRLIENSGDSSTRLLVGRYVAVLPECTGLQSPEQRFAAYRNPENHTGTGFGCATARNFAATIANPGDLKQGRALTPANGTSQALAIQRYRKLESPHPHANFKLQEVE